MSVNVCDSNLSGIGIDNPIGRRVPTHVQLHEIVGSVAMESLAEASVSHWRHGYSRQGLW